MSSMLSITKKVLIRAAVAAIFTVLWVNTRGEVITSAPIVFFGALYLSAAWFIYLRRDGLSLSRFKHPEFAKWAARLNFFLDIGKNRESIIESKETVIDEEPEYEQGGNDQPGINIAANIVSGILLIAVSFLF